MLRPVSRRIRNPSISICAQCSWRLSWVRQLATFVEGPRTKVSSSYNPVSHTTQAAQVEDQLLRDIFDQPRVWHELQKQGQQHPRVGLFRNKHLKHPDGFVEYARKTRQQAEELVNTIVNAQTEKQLQRVVKDLDRLSDLLCRVIDLAEFVRGTHPEAAMMLAANKAHTIMYEYMNILNTTTGLYGSLKRAMSNQKIRAGWSAEEEAVAKILLWDFEKSGITLPSISRRRFVELSNEIAIVGARFSNEAAPETAAMNYKSHELGGMDPLIVRTINQRGSVTIPVASPILQHALRTVDNEEIRRQMYKYSHTSSKKQLANLDELLRLRGELAHLVGHESYASVALSDKMAKSPTAVMNFLTSLASANRPFAQAELDQLIQLKLSSGLSTPFRLWDKDYYANKLFQHVSLRNSQHSRETSDSLSSYFSLGTVIQGLSRLFQKLYGVRLVPRESPPGETWNSSVRRLDVICERDGHIAVVYCDLFEREGKNPNPAHFTIRCSRQISNEEYLVMKASAPEHPNSADGMALARRPSDNALFQLPTIALICNFYPPTSTRPTLLRFREVQTLFHEMGHALHSMLGRTSLHNVAGTRCATDFAELPSVLMEHFAKSPAVLALFARHYSTDSPLPIPLLTAELEKLSLLEATETQTQIILALLDQAYHSTLPLQPGFDSSKVFHDVEMEYDLLPPQRKTSWQGFFTHLYGYGATYYSYLFDRAIAARVWGQVFERDPVSREAGEKYRGEVLRWGGSRDPWRSVAGVLGNGMLEDGGERAMAEVGRWGSELR